ncbi:VanZ family protein [Alicyclobacillus vulcanalis]|uniref:Glycopeptide antibiotics resistance protein n=1 Tax=Alicyclobacillus vulcanalis TaxID=252246 RepID=A0A1N7PPK2_9BACL|nr:VanZ family protein [Alicyclobacillus vulcanalis]SIT12417.1 Glycopeptide antibiotics resistance protein [Alicyclobacillus vulcanalis]
MITFLPIGLLCWGAYTALWVVRAALRRWRLSWRRMIAHYAFFLYVLGFIDAALFPIPLHGVPSLPEIDATPWATLEHAFSLRTGMCKHFARSFAFALPLGAALPVLYTSMRRFSLVLVLSFFTASAIQIAGLLISARVGVPYRLFEVDDILFTCMGAACGFALWRFVRLGRSTFATLKWTADVEREEQELWNLDSKAKLP